MIDRDDWSAANHAALVQQLERMRRLLTARVAGQPVPDEPAQPIDAQSPFALDRLCRLFGLSTFERDIVVLCAGIELDARIATLVADAHGDPGRRVATFGLALALLPGAHWSALSPDAPLRAWRIAEPTGPDLTAAPLRVDERVLHFIAGVDHLDQRLIGIVRELPALSNPGDGDGISRSDDDLVTRIAGQLSGPAASSVVQITSGDASSRLTLAARVCAALGVHSLRQRASDVPVAPAERCALARLIAREMWLQGALLVVDASGDVDEPRLSAFLESVSGPVLVCAADPVRLPMSRSIVFEVGRMTPSDSLIVWREALGEMASRVNGTLDALCTQFDLPNAAIRTVAAEAISRANPSDLGTRLWDGCRSAARPRLDGLAQRIEAIAGWDDLVVPDFQRQVLRALAVHVRHRRRVYEEWGFAEKSPRGLGITALFAGASGTGKTMAAEVLARELHLDLFRIDLAAVVSKYIGETEKNLKRLFDAAEGSGAILLFDEADALFGKRSEVKDSHDRYANIEISYLLQRMEAYRGLAILTSNLKQTLDPAFLRRLRFIVQFPFPDHVHRAAIWRGVFPARTPTDALDYERLGQLNVAGGHIRNIALAGAFLAAERDEAVSMPLLAEAARAEYSKLERPLTDAETRGWL
jgi:ATPase family protein associated with various cellular activities (AAA)/winged helix domain-containing protein